MEESYLHWLANETPTSWWHDSADPDELREGLKRGAVGVTTNPFLTYRALQGYINRGNSPVRALAENLTAEERAEALMKSIVGTVAQTLIPVYERTSGRQGYVCAQVNPARAADSEAMLRMAKRFHAWAPNIVVKLPATAAGLDALEECACAGITVAATVSFTVPQVVAVAERYRKGSARALQSGRTPGRCFAVIMIGRLDDYLWDVARDRKADILESDVRQAGLAVTKRSYAIYKERGYEATLLIAALRGTYHMVGLAGGELIMSLHPKIQAMLLEPGVPKETYIDAAVPGDVIRRLQAVQEFVRAYEPDGMSPEEFITYGATQRTLTQFTEAGWSLLESAGV